MRTFALRRSCWVRGNHLTIDGGEGSRGVPYPRSVCVDPTDPSHPPRDPSSWYKSNCGFENSSIVQKVRDPGRPNQVPGACPFPPPQLVVYLVEHVLYFSFSRFRVSSSVQLLFDLIDSRMAHWITFVLLVVATTILATESRVIPAEPISVMLDPYGNPIMFLREKRTAVHPYPQRAMMFTGYYRPVRRSNHGGQATGVFAQGNAVSGEAFFGGMQPPHLSNGPEPIEEPEVSSAEAQAAPEVDEGYNEDEQHRVQQEEDYQHNENPQQDERRPHDEANRPQGDDQQREEDEQHQHKQQTVPQEQPEPEPAPVFTTEAAAVTPAAEPVITNTEVSQPNRPKAQHGKKTKKTPVVVVDDDEEDDEDEDDDDEPSVPFIPFKGSRRRQNYPNLNNFFPMVFSFPGGSSRSGSSGGSPPGAVTAIANSYSTGKGGVASSVATAYGGSPNGKKRRTPVAEE